MRFTSPVVLLVLLGQAMAVPDVRPVLTMLYGDTGDPIRGFSPAPTGVVKKNSPQVLFKRATVPDSLCAYISADPYDRFSCYNGQFCGVRPDLGVVGCCTSYSQQQDGEYTLAGCEFRTTCYDRAQTSACTGTCTGDARVASCTRTDYPYCLKYSITDANLSFFRCNSVAGVTIQAAYNYTSPSTTPTETANTSEPPAASRNPSVTGSDGGAATVAAAPTATVFIDSSKGKSSVLGAAVGGAVGGAAVLFIAIGVGVWFWMKHKKHKKEVAAAAAAAAAAGAGAGAAGAYSDNNYDNHNGREYYKAGDAGMSQHHSGDVAPPYPSPPLAGGAYPFPITSPTFSTMSNSPMGTPYSQPLSQPLQEADGRAISPAQSPGPHVGGALFNRESTASPSVVGSEAQPYTEGTRSELGGPRSELEGPRSELEGPRSELEGPTSQHLSTASASGTGAQPSTTTTTQQRDSTPAMGFQSGPTGDWQKPYHELA